MNCPHCLQHVPEGSAFCPYCGAKVSEPEPGALPEALEDPTYGALAHANLLRLRGDWNAAREKTVAVLREYPNSGTAHSLMGDIFADQEMDEDAAQWYRMALELEPENAADKRKLATVEARLAEKEAAEKPDAAEEDAPPAFSGFRVAAWAAGAFLVLVIGLGLWLNQTSPRAPVEAPPAPRATEPLPPETRTPGAATRPESPEPAAPHEPAAPETQPEPGSTVPESAPPVVAEPHETHGEAGLRAQLANMEPTLARAGLSLADLQIDPRSQTLMVTLDGADVNGSDPRWMEDAYYAALTVVRNAFGLDRRLNHARVRVVMPLATRNGVERDTAFIGEVARPAGFDAVRSAELSNFDRRWWHLGLTPPPSIAATP